MGWPQIVFIGLMALSVGVTLAKHGEPRTGKHDVWAALLGGGITTGVVYAGGFFG